MYLGGNRRWVPLANAISPTTNVLFVFCWMISWVCFVLAVDILPNMITGGIINICRRV